ncbi:MptD family putative ECF transporter S component [Isobaculum melis]|uniref:Energy-coupling factor transport system substrate-specific component n=1 Tax=Isobaculum melis TaxID=142588 RepID=A0A1H9T2B6_9LACT|nr:MptD family putative ECF transporter S component [Isobaculum melis]SER91256.1 energy-coupling factor transport system substrate-specific component [Isobaculum melis]
MKKLKIQDYILIGIYTAIYFLVVCIAMILLQFTIPGYSSIFIPALTALFAGIVYLLVVNRIPRFGAITIMGSVMGIFFLISGHFPLSFLPNIICAVLADLLQNKTAISMKLRTSVSYIIFSFGLIGPVLPLWFMKNAYIDSLVARGKDTAYIDGVFAHITTGSFIASFLAIIMFSMVGIMIGQKLYLKHFSKVKGKGHGKNAHQV